MNKKEFLKYCQICGKEQIYSSNKDLNRAIKNNSLCKSCNNKTRALNLKKYKEIPVSWFDEKKRKAEAKGRIFEFDIEYIWKVYIRQDRKCALSGLPLDFNKDTENGMVSLDRIDNNKGYIKRNIQLVHKDVNFMKYVHDQKYFIKMCKLVAEKFKTVEREENFKILRNPS
jgi:hypothetical protein